MMSALTRKHDEVKRLLELYTIYKDCNEDWRRRKAHVDLDRFLMENRDIAAICIERVLADEIQQLIASAKPDKPKKTKLLRRWFGRRNSTANTNQSMEV